MKTREVRNLLNTLKYHVAQLDEWAHQASNMICEIEERLNDIEKKDRFHKSEEQDSIEFLNFLRRQ